MSEGQSGRPGARPGIVLFATVLLITVLAVALAAGSYLTTQAVVVARARTESLRARLAAESAVRAAAAGPLPTRVRALPLLGRRTLPGVLRFGGGAEGVAGVRRLGGDLFLVVGTGQAGLARGRASALVRILSPGAFLPSFPGALTVESAILAPGASVTTTGGYASPPPWPANACDPGARDTFALVLGSALLPGIVAARAPEAAGATIEGDPPVAVRSPPADSLGFGPIPWNRLGALADRVESGAVVPVATVTDGVCARSAAGNWGAPLDADSPCAGWFPLIFAPGDLRVIGGSGQGVLVVRGRLSLEAGARFYGTVLAAGGIAVEDDVELWGAVRARTADWSGQLHASPCAVLRALTEAPALARPFRAGARYWTPVF